MAKFQKGNPGRPVGAKNKNCMNPVFWWNLLEECIQQTPGPARIPHVFRALELLMPKVPTLPATPGDSAGNAAKAWETMNGLAPVEPSLESKPSALGGNGAV